MQEQLLSWYKNSCYKDARIAIASDIHPYSSNSKKLLVSEQIVGYEIANNEY